MWFMNFLGVHRTHLKCSILYGLHLMVIMTDDQASDSSDPHRLYCPHTTVELGTGQMLS